MEPIFEESNPTESSELFSAVSSQSTGKQAPSIMQEHLSPPRSTSLSGSRSGSFSKREFSSMSQPITAELDEDDADDADLVTAVRDETPPVTHSPPVHPTRPRSGTVNISDNHGHLKQQYTKVIAEKHLLEKQVKTLSEEAVTQTVREDELELELKQVKRDKQLLKRRTDGIDKKYEDLNEICIAKSLEIQELKQRNVIASRNETDAVTQMRSLKLLNAGLTNQIDAEKHNRERLEGYLKEARSSVARLEKDATKAKELDAVKKFIRDAEVQALATNLQLVWTQLQEVHLEQSELSNDLFYQGQEPGQSYHSASDTSTDVDDSFAGSSPSVEASQTGIDEHLKQSSRSSRQSSQHVEENRRTLESEIEEEGEEEGSWVGSADDGDSDSQDLASFHQALPAEVAQGVAVTAVGRRHPQVDRNPLAMHRVTSAAIETDAEASNNHEHATLALTHSETDASPHEAPVTMLPITSYVSLGRETSTAYSIEKRTAGLGISFAAGAETALLPHNKRSGFLPRPIIERTVSEPRLDVPEASKLDFLPATTYSSPDIDSEPSPYTDSLKSTPPSEGDGTVTEPSEYGFSPRFTPPRHDDAGTSTSPGRASESGYHSSSSGFSSRTGSSRPELSPGEVNTKDFAKEKGLRMAKHLTVPFPTVMAEDEGIDRAERKLTPRSDPPPLAAGDDYGKRLSLSIPPKGKLVETTEAAIQIESRKAKTTAPNLSIRVVATDDRVSQTATSMAKTAEQGTQTAAQRLSIRNPKSDAFLCLVPIVRPPQDTRDVSKPDVLKSTDLGTAEGESRTLSPAGSEKQDISEYKKPSVAELITQNIGNHLFQQDQSNHSQTPTSTSAAAGTPVATTHSERARPTFNIWAIILWVTIILILARAFVNERMFWMAANEPTRRRVAAMRDEQWNSVLVEKVLFSMERYLVREGPPLV